MSLERVSCPDPINMCVMSVSYYWEEGVWLLMHIASIRFRHVIQENAYICRANCTASFLPLSERYWKSFQASKIDSHIKWLVKMVIFSPTDIKQSIKPESAWVKVQLVSPADSLPESWPAERSGRRGWSLPGWASHTQLTAAWRTWSVTEKERKKGQHSVRMLLLTNTDSALTSFWYCVWKQL